MAIISTIQRHAYILVGIIALCILTFLYETINPNFNLLRNSSNYIGKANGETLDYDQYKAELDTKERELKVQKGTQNLTEEEMTGLKNQIWGQFLLKNVVDANMTKLGLGVSPKELVEITQGQNIDPSLKTIPAFQNQMGQYDPNQFAMFLKSLSQDDPNTPPGTRKKQWLEFEKQILNNRKITKFNSLIENSLFVPKWMSDFDTKLFGTNTDISFVALPYSTVDVSKLKFEKSEVEAFFKENKNKYVPVTPSVKLAAVAFALKPSQKDSVEIFNKFNVKMNDMVAATNDTAFFRAYGDKGYDLNYYKQTDIQQHPKLAELFTQAKNSIIGPYIDKDNVRAIKILDRKNISDSVFAKALTISFQDVAQNQDGIAKRLKLVDSIFRMLDTMNMDFDQIAAQYSADRGQNPAVWITTAEKIWNPEIFIHGGVRKYFKSPSDREGVVRIIKVLNFPANIPAVQMGEISSPYAPSTETQQSIYNNALSFIQKCKTAKDIVTLSKSNPLIKSNTIFVTQDNNTIEGIEGNGREPIRWAFDSKSGEISSMMQVGNNYVYCGNLGLRSKDHVEFADVEDDLLPDFKAEKAFKLIGEKLNGANLNEIASKNATTVQTIQGLSFNNSAINQMPEPALVAVASGLAVNKMSKPIRGTGGVYRIMNTKVNPTAVTPAEELNTKTQMTQQFKNLQGILEGMLNRYDVKDNRANMF